MEKNLVFISMYVVLKVKRGWMRPLSKSIDRGDSGLSSVLSEFTQIFAHSILSDPSIDFNNPNLDFSPRLMTVILEQGCQIVLGSH